MPTAAGSWIRIEEINNLRKEATENLNQLNAVYQDELAALNQEISAGLSTLVASASQIGEDSVSALVWALTDTDTKKKLSAAGSGAGTTAAISIQALVQSASDTGKETVNALVLALTDTDTKKTLAAAGSSAGTAAASGLQVLIQSANDTGKEAVNALTGALVSETSSYSKDFAGVVDSIKNGLKALPEEGKTLGENTAEGILEGLQSGIKKGGTSKYYKSVVTMISDGLKSAAQIHSPSRLFKQEIGEPMEAGILEGMEGNAAGAEKTAKSVVSRLLESAKEELGNGEFSLDLSYAYSGVDQLNRLTALTTQETQVVHSSDGGILAEMRGMVEEVKIMAENIKNLKVIMYPDTLAGTLQPYISREDAAASVRRTRGRL